MRMCPLAHSHTQLNTISAVISGLRKTKSQQMCSTLKCSQKYHACENEIVPLLTKHYSATLCFFSGVQAERSKQIYEVVM